MRRFLFLALLVLVLPGCAAHKITERDSFFSVSKDGKPVVSVTLDEGFVFTGEETFKEHGGSLTASTYARGQEFVLSAVAVAREGVPPFAGALMRAQQAQFKYAMHVPSSLPLHSPVDDFMLHASSGEFIFQDSGAMFKQYVYFFKEGSREFLVLMYCNASEGTFYKAHAYGEPLMPEQEATLEEFSKRADAAFKSIRFAH